MPATHRNSEYLKEADLKDARLWVETHRATIPAAVYDAVALLVTLRAELVQTKERASRLLAVLRRELGLTPKSERGSASLPRVSPGSVAVSDAERLAALKARRAKLLAEIRRYEDRLGKVRKSRKEAGCGGAAVAANTVVPGASPQIGGGAPAARDLSFQRSKETVFSGNLALAIAE